MEGFDLNTAFNKVASYIFLVVKRPTGKARLFHISHQPLEPQYVRPKKTLSTRLFTAVTLGAWCFGVLVHATFQAVLGSWYNGIISHCGLVKGEVVMIFAFALSTVTALLIEASLRLHSSLERCIVHLGTGLLVVPLVLAIGLRVMEPEMSGLQIGMMVGLECMFAATIWGVSMLLFGGLYESWRRRNRSL